jgi:hypothetical protein
MFRVDISKLLLDPFVYSISANQHVLGSIATYPHTYSLGFTPNDRALQQFEMQKSVRLQEVIIRIGERLVQHARFCGQEFFIPNNSTHVVAVLGSTDPVSDDWFLSDFCLLHKTLGTTAKLEHWLTCVDMHDAVRTLGRPIRHGPMSNLKTVFSSDSARFYETVEPKALADTFLHHIQDVASSVIEGDRLVIIIVAHGSNDGEVGIGKDDLGSDICITREDIEERLAFAANDMKTTIITTACYSGLWLLPLSTRFNNTLAAADQYAPSPSLLPSPSYHCNGGEFVHTLTEDFTKLAIHRDSAIHSVNNEPTFTVSDPTLQVICQAVSIGDIVTGHTIDMPPSGSIGMWAKTLQDKFLQITSDPTYLPAFHFDNPDLPASIVLGGNEELSTLIRAEAVLTLPYVVEDENSDIIAPLANVAPLALGIEEVVVIKSGNLHLPLQGRVSKLLEQYMVRGQDCAANNEWFTRVKMSISSGRANSQVLLEAHDLLRERLRADERATLVVSHYHPEFAKRYPIGGGDPSRWCRVPISKEDRAAFATVLKGFLHDCHDRCLPYRRQYDLPRRYATVAAVDRGLSPEELGRLLESIPKETWRTKLYPSSSSGSLGSSSSWKTVEDLKVLADQCGDHWNKH